MTKIIKLWPNLKDSNGDITQRLERKWEKNSNYYKTQQIKLNLGKTPNVKGIRNSNCDKAQILNKKN